jgi:hypothetical protein
LFGDASHGVDNRGGSSAADGINRQQTWSTLEKAVAHLKKQLLT